MIGMIAYVSYFLNNCTSNWDTYKHTQGQTTYIVYCAKIKCGKIDQTKCADYGQEH